jgi:ABC-type uncharacterized transport system ATPase subunit
VELKAYLIPVQLIRFFVVKHQQRHVDQISTGTTQLVQFVYSRLQREGKDKM